MKSSAAPPRPRAAPGPLEIPVPVGGGVWFALKVPAGADLRRAHFDRLRRYVAILESALASDAGGEFLRPTSLDAPPPAPR